ncbi:MAG: cytochrome c oxidase subunit 2A [Deinococcales bacterium]
MSDDQRSAPESGDGEYKPYGALLVTVVLAAVIIGFWALLFVLSLLRT